MYSLYSLEVSTRQRQDDLLRQAAHDRLVTEARRSAPHGRSAVRQARHALGALLIEAGQFLQGRRERALAAACEVCALEAGAVAVEPAALGMFCEAA